MSAFENGTSRVGPLEEFHIKAWAALKNFRLLGALDYAILHDIDPTPDNLAAITKHFRTMVKRKYLVEIKFPFLKSPVFAARRDRSKWQENPRISKGRLAELDVFLELDLMPYTAEDMLELSEPVRAVFSHGLAHRRAYTRYIDGIYTVGWINVSNGGLFANQARQTLKPKIEALMKNPHIRPMIFSDGKTEDEPKLQLIYLAHPGYDTRELSRAVKRLLRANRAPLDFVRVIAAKMLV